MAMQFNPHTAFLRGMDLGSPTTSQGGINNLLQMQQNTLNGLTDTIGNIGKTSRTNTVNDLIARGGLEGLNEAQTQAKIAQTAGGTLTPEGQMQVDKLLQLTGKQDERNFTDEQRRKGETFKVGEREQEQTFRSGESDKERQQRLLLEKMGITSNEKIAGQRDSTTRRGQDLDYKSQSEGRKLQQLLGLAKVDSKTDPIKELGLSKEAEQDFRAMAPDIRASLLGKDGKMLPNVGFVKIPAKRDGKGNLLRAESYRWENSDTGKEIPISRFQEAQPEKSWYQKIF